MKHVQKQLNGFSLGELLVVILLVALLAIVILMTYQNQVAKANDAKRKEHLNKYKIAFEDYYNDHNCYPTKAVWDACACDSTCLSPYMDKFLCDPVTGLKYYYFPFTDAEGVIDTCMGYRLYSKLGNTGDPDITRVGCSPIKGCGDDTRSAYNYGITIPGPLVEADFNPQASPTPTPTTKTEYLPNCESSTGPWACSIDGVCNHFQEVDFTIVSPATSPRCPVGFLRPECCNECPESYPRCSD